jgi:alkylated DNA repair dioxygenase AlkB
MSEAALHNPFHTVLERGNSRLVVHHVGQEGQELLRACEQVKNSLEHYPMIMLYGKQVHQRRWVGFFSDESEGYRYSRTIAKSQPLTPELRNLLDFVNGLLAAEFNGILVNFYETGADYISKHSDDEKGLDPVIGVVSMSLGAERTFRIRDKESNEIVLDIPTREDELLQMAGDFQRVFTHEIPKQMNVGARLSFTFRKHTH